MSNAQISLESGDQLDVRTFAVHEAMNASFQIDIVAMGSDDLDLSKLSGRPASFGISGPSGPRIWTGVCSRATQTSVEPDGLSAYAIQIVPVFWLINHRRNHRAFQHLSIPEIVQKLLGEWKLPFELDIDAAAYGKREFAVQYGETDHDFLRRILVTAGISFFFKTPEGEKETKMVLSDKPQSAPPRDALPFVRSASSGEKMEHITGVTIAHNVRPGRAVVRDFDFRRPSFPLAGTHSGDSGGTDSLLEEYFYVPGASNVQGEAALGGTTPFGDSAGSYRHNEKEATSQAQKHVEAMAGAKSRIGFNTSALTLSPGTVFQ